MTKPEPKPGVLICRSIDVEHTGCITAQRDRPVEAVNAHLAIDFR